MKNTIPFNQPFVVGKELYYISRAVIEGQLSGDGYFTNKCHDWLEHNLGCKKALLTHSCTAALEMAAMLIDIKPGDEVIMPSFTFVSTANAFALRGGIPVFIDIRQDNMNIDESLIENAITDRTKAIVPVHYAGSSCAMDLIMDLAETYKLNVIEDAAQALLSTHNGQYLGCIGHLGCLSFHETKNIISGEGGALLVNDPLLIEKAEIVREKGTNRKKFFRGEIDKYTWVDLGSSYLPSELIGAFLYAQLEQAKAIISKRTQLFERYMEGLKPLAEKKYFRLPWLPDECCCNGHIIYLLTRSLSERTSLINHLKEQNIYSVFHYIPLHSSPAGIKYGKMGSDMTVTNDLSERVLRLPLFFEMTTAEVDRVVSSVADFYEARSSIKYSNTYQTENRFVKI